MRSSWPPDGKGFQRRGGRRGREGGGGHGKAVLDISMFWRHSKVAAAGDGVCACLFLRPSPFLPSPYLFAFPSLLSASPALSSTPGQSHSSPQLPLLPILSLLPVALWPSPPSASPSSFFLSPSPLPSFRFPCLLPHSSSFSSTFRFFLFLIS